MIELSTPEQSTSWNLISTTPQPGELIDDTIARALAETLGPNIAAHRLDRVPGDVPSDRSKHRRLANRDESFTPGRSGAPIGVELSGAVEPRGGVLKFTWYLVTVLPPQATIRPEHRSLLADFLDAHGEPGLAARLRQFL
jgi:hypothetical protein